MHTVLGRNGILVLGGGGKLCCLAFAYELLLLRTVVYLILIRPFLLSPSPFLYRRDSFVQTVLTGLEKLLLLLLLLLYSIGF